MARIGVLALQGGYAAHARRLEALGHGVELVRYASQVAELDGLVLPGGESTTQLKLIAREGLEQPLDTLCRSGRPVLATCAGLILSAARVTEPDQRSFGWLDISVRRNGWGRQLDSFEATADGGDLPLVFIRAPRITRVGNGVEVLARCAEEPVLVRCGALWGATFHPELTEDQRIHRWVFGEGRGDS